MDQTEQNEPHRKICNWLHPCGRKYTKQIEEIIVDEEGTHRIGGINESDHNTILLTIDTKMNRDKEKNNLENTIRGKLEQFQQNNEK